MKNSIKSKKTISIILTVILLLFTTKVYAANDSFKTALSVNNSTVKRGENVIVTILLNNISIESGEKGIGAYTSKLDFDSSVLEYVETKGTDKWEAPFYQEKQITGTTNDGKVVNTNQSIGTITFKVKENAILGETTIKLTNFSGSTAESDVPSEDTSIKITIVDNSNGGSGNGSGSSSGNEDQNGGNGSGNTQNGGTSNNSSNGEDIKEGQMPNTGYSNITIYILITIFSLMAIGFGIRIKLLNKRIKKN